MFGPHHKSEGESSSRRELRRHDALELAPVMLEVVGCELAGRILEEEETKSEGAWNKASRNVASFLRQTCRRTASTFWKAESLIFNHSTSM